MSKMVSAREANQHFSRVLSEVEAGETVTITKRGRKVATIAPVRERAAEAARRRALEKLFAMMDKGLTLRGPTKVAREDIYDRSSR
jgi:prevent-host-death family protein